MEPNTEHQIDLEANAIATISVALKPLDEDARFRVFDYVARRFSFSVASHGKPTSSPGNTALAPAATVERSATTLAKNRDTGEIDGIAISDGEDALRITIRDLKARSGLDAAVRLAHIAIYACDKLLRRPMSSRNELTPLLKEWRLYDGNTRARLAKEKGIVRDDDNLKLDAHARKAAEAYIAEVLDDTVSGRWKP